MFAKIIMKNRGGICFELNGLYNWLLESLGYKVTSYAARFIDRLEEYQIRRHRVMCIELEDKRYLTDVCVNSESPRCPLEMAEGKVQSDGICAYHEVFPIYHQPEIQKVITNAVKLAAPINFPNVTYGNPPPVVEIKAQLEHSIQGLHEKKEG